jgi:hypothetical protein
LFHLSVIARFLDRNLPVGWLVLLDWFRLLLSVATCASLIATALSWASSQLISFALAGRTNPHTVCANKEMVITIPVTTTTAIKEVEEEENVSWLEVELQYCHATKTFPYQLPTPKRQRRQQYYRRSHREQSQVVSSSSAVDLTATTKQQQQQRRQRQYQRQCTCSTRI